MISLVNVQKIYPPDQIALKNISLKIGAGEFVFLAGASGAGKSSLMKLLYGAELATTGEVVIGGRRLKQGMFDISEVRQDIGVIFQDYKLLPRRSVIDNVSFGLEVRGVQTDSRRELAKELLVAIGLGERLNALPQTLSGGEQQRVAIARALITQPRIILADEPTGNLDPEMTRIVFELLLEANSLGVTIIVATHNLAIVEELNRRTIVLDRGKIIGDFERPRGGGRGGV
jgi:cell division transport system ATP-binding protein